MEAEPDAHRRLHTLLTHARSAADTHRAGAVELALQPSAAAPAGRAGAGPGHPAAARLPDRTVRRARLPAPEPARRRGLLAYTAYLGHAQLAHATPELAPGGRELPGYVDAVIATLTSR